VSNDGDKSLSKDEALEKAIEAGAEDVVDGFDDNDKPALKVFSQRSLLLLQLTVLCLTRLDLSSPQALVIPYSAYLITFHSTSFH